LHQNEFIVIIKCYAKSGLISKTIKDSKLRYAFDIKMMNQTQIIFLLF